MTYRVIEEPALVCEEPVDDIEGDGLLQSFQFPYDQCALGPRTGVGYVQVVAA